MDFSTTSSKYKSNNSISTQVSFEYQQHLDDSFSLMTFPVKDEEQLCSFNEFILNCSLILESAKLSKKPIKTANLNSIQVSIDSLLEKGPPVIPFSKYLDRLFSESFFTRKYFHYAILYTIRLLDLSNEKNRVSLHKLFAVALYVAQKYIDDDRKWGKKAFSKISGIQEKNIDQLEIEFCVCIDFRLYINKEQFEWIRNKSNGVPVTQVKI